MSKLILIDGNAVMHRAFHALPPLTTRDGEPINAVYGLVSMLLGLIQNFKPEYIAVAFDRKEPTFRKKLLVSYQAQRPVMDSTLSSQFEKAVMVLEAFKIPIYSQAGFEADDLIGTLSVRTVEGKEEVFADEVIIVTGDRDILQLVNDKVKVYLPTKGVSEGKVYDKNEVLLKLGCLPEQIVDYKALVGDQSDNYPGVPGVGPKTATALLSKYGSYENIYNNLNQIPENTRKKLEEGKESGDLSYRLAKIITDMEIDVDLSLAGKWEVDSNEVLELFSEYGFKTLSERVKKVGKEIEKEKQESLF